MNEPVTTGQRQPVPFDEPFVEPKVGSAAWMMTPKLLPKLRKAGRVAGVYFLSYVAVETLDKVDKAYPDNKLIDGADQAANFVLGGEDLAVSGALMLAKTGYNALAAPDEPKPPMLQPPEPEFLKEPEASQAIHPKYKHHRNRAPLNATLMSTEGVAENIGEPKSQPVIRPAPYIAPKPAAELLR